MPRFGPPQRHQVHERRRVGGLAAEGEVVPDQGHVRDDPGDEGWYGVRSRSRFLPPPPARVEGHGTVQLVKAAPQPPDPGAGRTRFGTLDAHRSLSEGPWHEFDPSLGDDDRRLVRAGVLRYVRRYREAFNSGGTKLAPPPPISDPPVPVSRRTSVFTLRPEFRQRAQTFSFMHTRVEKYARTSTSPVRMGPPRTNRLTRRSLPVSFGSQTTVLT